MAQAEETYLRNAMQDEGEVAGESKLVEIINTWTNDVQTEFTLFSAKNQRYPAFIYKNEILLYPEGQDYVIDNLAPPLHCTFTLNVATILSDVIRATYWGGGGD